ncbi:50S ribosomal protein L6 [Candidatus Woesearchaeota archaeon]|nr:50S ribosomal protein L6 [Candidatus Woesearchaeota archaeon]
MTNKGFQDEIELPEGCQVSFENKTIKIHGEKGEADRKLFDPAVAFKSEGNKIIITTRNNNKRNKKMLNTYKAHIKNLIKGATESHIYKLKICSGHFPMTVGVKDNLFEIKNFIGEKVPRQLEILEGTEVKVDGAEVIVKSVNKEKAGQMAASIEQLTRRPGFDKRIFQDGIYLTEKDGKPIE